MRVRGLLIILAIEFASCTIKPQYHDSECGETNSLTFLMQESYDWVNKNRDNENYSSSFYMKTVLILEDLLDEIVIKSGGIINAGTLANKINQPCRSDGDVVFESLNVFGSIKTLVSEIDHTDARNLYMVKILNHYFLDDERVFNEAYLANSTNKQIIEDVLSLQYIFIMNLQSSNLDV